MLAQIYVFKRVCGLSERFSRTDPHLVELLSFLVGKIGELCHHTIFIADLKAGQDKSKLQFGKN